ncbi:DNA-binding transcriptional LysR family regulator [Bradyrhizobium sp. USDA 3315]
MRDDAQVCQLVSEGVGIGIVSLSNARRAAGSWSIRQVALTDTWTERRMFACIRAKDSLSRPAKLLFEHLTKVDAVVAQALSDAQ